MQAQELTPLESTRPGREPAPAAGERPDRSRRRRRLAELGVGLALLSVFPLARFLRPFVAEDGPATCTFRLVTGRPCPLCGLTRAFTRAAHGEFGAASEFHPLWWLFALTLAAVGLVACVDAAAGGGALGRAGRLFERHYRVLLALLAAAAAVRLLV